LRCNPRSLPSKKMFQRRLELEGLEERSLLSATLSATGVLTVNGDDSGVTNDTILLLTNPSNPNLFEAVVNGQTQCSQPVSTVKQIVVNSGGGNDNIGVQNLPFSNTPLTINGGDNNDTITVGTGTLELIAGAVTVNGQGGVDSVILNDS